MISEPVTIVTASGPVSGLWQAPAAPRSCLMLAHGAGAGMTHRSITAIADGLEVLGVATLRYQFPYMERGSKRVDSPALAQATVRAAVAEALRRVGPLPLFAGGRSFGARMTSHAQAAEPLVYVRGLVFFAFPLHPAGRPATARADHLQHVTIPMLFLQGDRDSLADFALLRETVEGLAGRATLHLIDSADHAFHVPSRTGRRDDEVLAEALAKVAAWMDDP